MGRWVLDLRDMDRTRVARAGGKGAHLGELSRIEGIRVPAAFCVTTDAFRRVVAGASSLENRIERLSRLAANHRGAAEWNPDDREAIRALSAEIRDALEAVSIPDDVAAAIARALDGPGRRVPCAVRSSATVEDQPEASFAGQFDTFLNVVGPEAVLRHVARCWASLFADRAVTYRLRNGLDHRGAGMAVVVQRMLVPQAAGVMFTANPVTSNRKVASIEACFGLGEALVSGMVNGDAYEVRDDVVIATTVAIKRVALDPAPAGGTRQRAVEAERQEQPVLTAAQVVRLARLGRRIEAHFGSPQDIEWCLVDDDFHIVQSRPITTLFPIPDAADGENRLYVSVGHQQMMTDAMKPLGLSVWQLTTARPMAEAGGRLFVDVTGALASPASRAGMVETLVRSDPLIGDALRTILDRGDFIAPEPDEDGDAASAGHAPAAGHAPSDVHAPSDGHAPSPIETDPTIVAELIERSESSIVTLKREIRTMSGPALLDFILEDLQELKRILFDPRSHRAIMAGVEATWWLNDRLEEWLGETNAADALALSAPGNVTSEMGLALLDVADVIRPHPEVVEFLESVAGNDDFLDELPALEGGREARDAIRAWLDRYGMRCVGEIDITRPRWSERPGALVPVILGNIRHFGPGAAARRFEEGRQRAATWRSELLERLRALPDGDRKADEAARMMDRLRTFIGYREYPKYTMVSRYFVYRRALLQEARRLVQAGVLRDGEDIFLLRFRELHDVVRTHRVDHHLIRQRRHAFRVHQALIPPRVLTSDGEVISGTYRRDDVPPGALIGLPVSAGIVEGRARVIRDIADADLEPGDVLVTTCTDPSWTPLFVAVRGLVTEVGGLMTHGAVIAREYGLPAVVGVEHATRRIADGQRIRVHGTHGYVEIVSRGEYVNRHSSPAAGT